MIRERSQMMSSKIRGFQTPSPSLPSVTFIPLEVDDVIFHQLPFPKTIFGKIVFYDKNLNITKSGFSYEYERFRYKITHLIINKYQFLFLLLTSCYFIK